MLESHVRLGLETNACTEDVGQSGALLGKRVDDGSSGRGQGSLEHVAQNTEDAVEALVLGSGGTVGGSSLPLDTGHHLGNDDQINDQGRGEEGVLADVEHAISQVSITSQSKAHAGINLRNGLVATHENLGIVLVQGTLVVSDGGHVLDDDAVVGVLALLVQYGVGLHHIIDNIGLGDLLGAELLLGAQVLAVVVAKVVVAGN